MHRLDSGDAQFSPPLPDQSPQYQRRVPAHRSPGANRPDSESRGAAGSAAGAWVEISRAPRAGGRDRRRHRWCPRVRRGQWGAPGRAPKDSWVSSPREVMPMEGCRGNLLRGMSAATQAAGPARVAARCALVMSRVYIVRKPLTRRRSPSPTSKSTPGIERTRPTYPRTSRIAPSAKRAYPANPRS